MNRSTERFLTTHTGSLPRPADLVELMFAKEEGAEIDGSALEARIQLARAVLVQHHAGQGTARPLAPVRCWRRCERSSTPVWTSSATAR